MVIEPCPVTFVQNKSNQIIGLHDTIHTSWDTVVKTAFTELQMLP